MSDLRARYNQVMLPVFSPPPPVLVRGCGARVWDDAGREYVDFGSGVAVLSLGHAPPSIVKAVGEQAAKLMHTSNLHVNDAATLLAQKLVSETFAERVFLCNSGTEANEAAIKLARYRGVQINPQKYRVLAFSGGFHGRGGMAMAATEQEKVRAGFGPLAPGFHFAQFNDLPSAAAQMDDNFCAIIVEPIQGDGGVNLAAPEFLCGLKKLAADKNALLIFDEIQTGAGRTGALYAYMEMGVVADVLTSAKGLGGGFPVAAMLVGDRAADVLPAGAHGTTYGGNPLAARAALAVLDELLSAGFLPGVKTRGEELIKRLSQLNQKFNCFAEIRGRGLLVGCQMREGLIAADVVAAALAAGLIVITAANNVLRFAPALNIAAQDIEEGFLRLQEALAAVCS